MCIQFTMKKSLVGPIIGTIVAILIAALFIYFYISLNRMEKQIISAQQSVVDDSNKIAAIVNFFNSAQNATTK